MDNELIDLTTDELHALHTDYVQLFIQAAQNYTRHLCELNRTVYPSPMYTKLDGMTGSLRAVMHEIDGLALAVRAELDRRDANAHADA
jgi:hypothetical protein